MAMKLRIARQPLPHFGDGSGQNRVLVVPISLRVLDRPAFGHIAARQEFDASTPGFWLPRLHLGQPGHALVSINQFFRRGKHVRIGRKIIEDVHCVLGAVEPEFGQTVKSRRKRSEEHKGGKECGRTCRSWWSPYHSKNTRDNSETKSQKAKK